MQDGPSPELDDLLLAGYFTPERAAELDAAQPGTRGSVLGWAREALAAGNWARAGGLVNLAAALRVPGLGELLCGLVETGDVRPGGPNLEDAVDILGELQDEQAVGPLFRLVQRVVEAGTDAPAFWLCQKAVFSLAEIGTDEADARLIELTGEAWPGPVRWHAAVALGVEDELGFDEDELLNER
ncbi:hypothetical protein DN069_29630 [Streptacidiphilus pinicola]|uniref:HEAT repeat domain-containing protein n=1 Tax=Streptacidiphilus pinicola TaxID=2219663 RepID=A0A2X0IC21_9ACTN|nr:HEAT repeat domain-containing protein [Streptacidiphilus pinicola]RAG82057.1 hypothetical protein DN069_29630 [Streptacidiphilus pinicola]